MKSEPYPPPTTYSHEEREAMLRQMEETSSVFYFRAFQIGCHTFLEFTGLLNEYIKLCRQAHDAGIDFTEASAHSGKALPMQPHHAAYLGEKLGCIYGASLQEPANAREFLRSAGLAALIPQRLCPRHWEYDANTCPECHPPKKKVCPDHHWNELTIDRATGEEWCSECDGVLAPTDDEIRHVET